MRLSALSMLPIPSVPRAARIRDRVDGGRFGANEMVIRFCGVATCFIWQVTRATVITICKQSTFQGAEPVVGHQRLCLFAVIAISVLQR